MKADAEHRRLLAANEARISNAKKMGKTLREASPALWFDYHPSDVKPGEGLRYRSNGKYWQTRASGNFSSPDIFGLQGKSVRRFIPEE
jgi:hypothetical protein